ncbi:Aste57867_11914 [Aphanomyces stellatus]|uniref:Aste57867_11914 protein n=1 Tax=Aphanomyces stellatus TaxID=120398 RepID=A0A485KU93_9STRA|nr:hypothetical protein As57867_011869 [Aphanomyces stellatus]VFT88769.1 Aste57867_11914 [Aphanomyces stellatus]
MNEHESRYVVAPEVEAAIDQYYDIRPRDDVPDRRMTVAPLGTASNEGITAVCTPPATIPIANNGPYPRSIASRPSRWPIYSMTSRIFSVLAALLVLYSEVTSSIANKRVLFGTSSPHQTANAYASQHIASFVAAIVSNPDQTKGLLQALAPSMPPEYPYIAYLDIPGSTSTVAALQPIACTPPVLVADFLFDIAYVQPLLQYTLSEVGDWLNATNNFIVVDCSFDGRTLGDTTAFKLYLIDKTMTNLSTLIVQTMSVSRPDKHLLTTGGVAMITTTPLASLIVDQSTQIVTSTVPATYSVTIGFTFPYEWDTFQLVVLDDLIPPTGQWHATVQSTGERFLFAGTTGIYHGSPTVEANFGYYYWDLPSDPIAFLGAIQFVNVFVRKDVWGWFRCCLGLGIGFNIAVNTLVSLVVVVNLWCSSRIVWVPDVYPAIQRRACLRAILLLVDCFANNWWYPYTFALNQGGFRTNWVGTLFLDEIVRADGLMICLAIVYGAAKLVRVRLKLFVVVAMYVSCFYMRLSLVNRYGVCPNDALAVIENDYFANVLGGNGGMDLWAYREDYSVHHAIIANELTWLFIAVGLSLVFVLLTKLVLVVSEVRVAREDRKSISTAKSTVRATLTWWSPLLRRFQQRRSSKSQYVPSSSSASVDTHASWARRSLLYDALSDLDTDNTHIERSVGLVVSDMTGFVASTADYVTNHNNIPFVSLSGVWLLGFVVVNDRLLVSINDFIFVVLNVVLRRNLFRIYGFAIVDNVVARHKHQIYPSDVRLCDLVQVSLKPLR